MSVMSALATELDLVAAGEIPATQQFLDALVSLGYEPAQYITKIDVFDSSLALAECGECGFADVVAEMVAQVNGEFLCPGCDYDYATGQGRGKNRVGR